MEPNSLLAVSDLSVTFTGSREVRAVRGVSYHIREGETLALVGESGSGKSTSALALAGLLQEEGVASTGSVIFRGQELMGAPEHVLSRIRGKSIGVVFQDPSSSLNPVLTIGRQISEVLEVHLNLRHKAAMMRAIDLLKMVEMPDALAICKQYPHQLSGGMRQRVMLAVALACEPSLLILDEPTTALDVTIEAQIMDLLRLLRTELELAILLISHDIGVVAGIADRIAIMYAGRIVEIGQAEDVLIRPVHPYTAALLRSIPNADQTHKSRLPVIIGDPPDLSTAIVGCAFAPRCDFVRDACLVGTPELKPVADADSVQVACIVRTG